MLLDLGDPAGRTAWTVSADDGRTFAVFALDDGSYRVSDAASGRGRAGWAGRRSH